MDRPEYVPLRKIICNVTQHNSFSSRLTAVIEVCKQIFYLLEYIIIFLHRCFYDMLCVMLSLQILNFSYAGFLQEFIHNLILGLPYSGKFTYPVKISIRKSAYCSESSNE